VFCEAIVEVDILIRKGLVERNFTGRDAEGPFFLEWWKACVGNKRFREACARMPCSIGLSGSIGVAPVSHLVDCVLRAGKASAASCQAKFAIYAVGGPNFESPFGH
jgi:hypothetical protein